MEDVPVPPEMVQDPPGKSLGVGRDPQRTPMQWDAAANAGFTTGNPWLPISESYRTVNVEAEREDPESMLSLYRALIDLRQSQPALMVGSYQGLPAEGDLIAFTRTAGDDRFLVVLNLGSQEALFPLRKEMSGECVLSTHLDREGEATGDALELRPDEGVIVRLWSA